MSMLHAYRRAEGDYLLAPSWSPHGVPGYGDHGLLYLGTVQREGDELLRMNIKAQIEAVSYAIVSPEQFYSRRWFRSHEPRRI